MRSRKLALKEASDYDNVNALACSQIAQVMGIPYLAMYATLPKGTLTLDVFGNFHSFKPEGGKVRRLLVVDMSRTVRY